MIRFRRGTGHGEGRKLHQHQNSQKNSVSTTGCSGRWASPPAWQQLWSQLRAGRIDVSTVRSNEIAIGIPAKPAISFEIDRASGWRFLNASAKILAQQHSLSTAKLCCRAASPAGKVTLNPSNAGATSCCRRYPTSPPRLNSGWARASCTTAPEHVARTGSTSPAPPRWW